MEGVVVGQVNDVFFAVYMPIRLLDDLWSDCLWLDSCSKGNLGFQR